MALRMNLTEDQTNVGVAAPAAYARIVEVKQSFLDGSVEVAVNVYANQGARNNNKSPVTGGRFSAVGFTPTPGQDIRAGLYTWLKAQPLFAGAQDAQDPDEPSDASQSQNRGQSAKA